MNFDNAVQIYAPDKQKLAELVIKAKGNKRTMAQFAIDTGISAPTLSRISNGKISNPRKEKSPIPGRISTLHQLLRQGVFEEPLLQKVEMRLCHLQGTAPNDVGDGAA